MSRTWIVTVYSEPWCRDSDFGPRSCARKCTLSSSILGTKGSMLVDRVRCLNGGSRSSLSTREFCIWRMVAPIRLAIGARYLSSLMNRLKTGRIAYTCKPFRTDCTELTVVHNVTSWVPVFPRVCRFFAACLPRSSHYSSGPPPSGLSEVIAIFLLTY